MTVNDILIRWNDEKNYSFFCFSQSLKGFEVINEYGFSTVKGEREKIESNRIYASCLRQNGFVFNASYKYCYKFPSVCQKYNEYR